MSTSRNPETALRFASRMAPVDYEPVVVEIMPSKSTRVISIDNDDSGLKEDETILDFGQSLRIESIIDNVELFSDGRKVAVKYVIASMVSEEESEDDSLSKSVDKVLSLAYFCTQSGSWP